MLLPRQQTKLAKGWPAIEIERVSRRETYVLPWSTFPASLKEDVDRFLDRLSGRDLSDDGPLRAARPATLRTREYQLRVAASALVHRGHDQNSVRSIADLLSFERYQEILRFLLDRHDGQTSPQVGQLAGFLKDVARHWLKVDEPELQRFRKIASRLAVGRQGMTPKNRERLRPFDEPEAVIAFLGLPQRIRRELKADKRNPRRKAILAQMAAAIALLQAAPIRLKNLTELDLDKNLIARGKRLYLVIAESDTKNREPIDFELPVETVELLSWYVREYRPLLLKQPTDALFPGAGSTAKSSGTLAVQIPRTVFKYTGLKVNVHLFRHAGGKIFLDARPGQYEVMRRVLAPRSVRLRRDQIYAAVTALVDSGIKPSAIRSIADLVSPDHFKHILRKRLESANNAENSFNLALGQALIQIAHEWVKVDAQVFAELKRLIGRMRAPVMALTDKNKRALRQFDDPAVLRRLYALPERLWAEARRDKKPNFRTLAKAQGALAIGILSYMPLRLQNLAALEFDTHLFMHTGPRAISTLELNAGEVKNAIELAFDIPPNIAKMLIEYRDRFAPTVIGRRPTRLFVNADGTPKNQATVAGLIMTYLQKRAGIVLTPHQFRHLSAKVVLDAEPGGFETVKQFLGHKSIKTTVGAYAGIDSRRAARRHQYLVEQALAPEMPALRSNRRRREPLAQESRNNR